MGEMMDKQTILCALDEIEAEVTSWRHFFANTKAGWRWIPCSERLPEHSGIYLVTLTVAVEKYVVVRWYSQRGGWICDEHPEAWMPLPEPYKEDDHETD